ncbi:hypothetical protein ACFV42_48195 [Streptomyces solisilvae]|uniref:hypothetical protein n=1 Tax=Streptomyces malaysiensis TaxID=92644 RepID=UPI0036D09EC1
MPDAPVVRPPSVFDGGYLLEAVTDLCSRAGARSVEIGYVLPSGEAGPVDWYVSTDAGPTISERGHPTPAAAFYALACRLTAGMRCACSLHVALDPGEDYPDLPRPWATERRGGIAEARRAGWCLWQPYGKRWRPPCGMPADEVPGRTGDEPQVYVPALLP